MASHKMTVIGMVDPVNVVSKLRKASWSATIDSVGPAKEPEKKEEGEKKDGGEDKKDGGEAKKEGDGEKKEGEGDKKKEGDDKDGDGKKAATEQQMLAELMNQYRAYYYPYPPMMTTPYYVQSMEEDPNSCTIC